MKESRAGPKKNKPVNTIREWRDSHVRGNES